MQIRIKGDTAQQVRELAGSKLERAREDFVRETMTRTLQQTIVNNPVDTGRSRAAWVSSLEELGGAPPAGWEGPHPTQIEAGRRLGKLRVNSSRDISEVTATNAVHYIGPLEYGTSRMSPFAMARRGLLKLTGRLRELFRFE